MKKEIYSYLVKDSLIKLNSNEDVSIKLVDISIESNISGYDIVTKNVIPVNIKKVGKVKNTWNLVKVNLNNKCSFICTPDTYILLWNDEYKKVRDLNILDDYPKSITGKLRIRSIESITLSEKSEVYSMYLNGNIDNFELDCGIFIKSSKF